MSSTVSSMIHRRFASADAQRLPGCWFLTRKMREAIWRHACVESPAECCGLVWLCDGEQEPCYVRAINVAPSPTEMFSVDPVTLAACEDGGTVLAVVHSHPNASANPSMADRTGCEECGVPWIIVGWPSAAFTTIEPCGWSAPLLAREFCFGIHDCYGLVRDFYARHAGTVLPNFERHEWFERRGENLIRDQLDEAGFDPRAGAPRYGDVLCMRVRSPSIDNHLAIYIGKGRMLHHLVDRLSEEEYWSTAWQRRTTAVLRHRTARFAEVTE